VAIDPEQVRVVLVRTRNPLNIGACARAMSNFGFRKLRVVQPYDVAFREAKSAVGGAAVLQSAEEFESVAEAVGDCTLVIGTTAAKDRELHHELVVLNEAVPRIESAGGPIALLFGSEKRGLLNEDLSHCHWLMQIPTHDENVSMNLGQAVAVCLYELSRDGAHGEVSVAAEVSGQRVSAGDEERITELLLQALHESGYVKPIAMAATAEKTRRMVRRMNLSDEDAEVWMGMLRKLLWKLGVREG
jgi:TrmH family RNA methyltransferase